MSVLLPPWRRRTVRSVAALAAAVFALSLASVVLRPSGSSTAVFWPSAGLSVAWVMRARRRDRAALLVAVALASGAANMVGGRTAGISAAFGLLNALEALVVCAWLTRSGAGTRRLRRVGDVVRFLVAVLLGSLVTATGIATSVWLLLDASPWAAARTGTVAHAAAILLVAPLLLVEHQAPDTPLRRAEVALQWFTTLLATVVVFAPGQSLPLTFLPMPALVWGAVRLGPRTTVWQMAAVGVLSTMLTVLGGGPFAAAQLPPDVTVALVQLFLLVYGCVVLVLAVGIHRRGVAAELVADQEALFRGGFDQALLGMLLVRYDGRVLRVLQGNDVAARLLGRAPDRLIGSAWCRSIAPEDLVDFEAGVLSVVAGTSAGWHGELRMLATDTERWLEVAIAPTGAAGPQPVLSVQMVDVTERRIAHDRLARLALHDPLTNLPNRVLLLDRLRHALPAAQRTGRPVAVLYLDLDGFKQVNDLAGHEQGDLVLRETARLLRTVVREADTVARLGGDEFVILSEITGTEAAEQIVDRVTAALHRTVVIGGRAYRLRVSVGVATSSATSTAENLLHEADTAMYENKRRSRAGSDTGSDARSDAGSELAAAPESESSAWPDAEVRERQRA